MQEVLEGLGVYRVGLNASSYPLNPKPETLNLNTLNPMGFMRVGNKGCHAGMSLLYRGKKGFHSSA